MEKLPYHKKKFDLNTQSILTCIQGYKLAILVFSLNELGLLSALEKEECLTEFISENNLKPEIIDYLLEVSVSVGLINIVDEKKIKKTFDFVECFVSMEHKIMDMMTTDEIVKISKLGTECRTFDSKIIPSEIKSIYAQAMYGRETKLYAQFNLRYLPKKEYLSSLEISSGPALYTKVLDRNYDMRQVYFCSISNWYHEASELLPKNCKKICSPISFDHIEHDLVILSGVSHGVANRDILQEIIKALKQDSLLLIDDLFLDENCTDYWGISLDWLIHGGNHHITLQKLITYLDKQSLFYRILPVFNNHPLRRAILISHSKLNYI